MYWRRRILGTMSRVDQTNKIIFGTHSTIPIPQRFCSHLISLSLSPTISLKMGSQSKMSTPIIISSGPGSPVNRKSHSVISLMSLSPDLAGPSDFLTPGVPCSTIPSRLSTTAFSRFPAAASSRFPAASPHFSAAPSPHLDEMSIHDGNTDDVYMEITGLRQKCDTLQAENARLRGQMSGLE